MEDEMIECECGDEDCAATGFCLNSVDSDFWDDPTTGTTRHDSDQDDFEPWALSDANPCAPQYGDGE